jgi:hypothetical protein
MKYIITIALLFVVFSAVAETPTIDHDSSRPVRISDWARTIFIFPPQYWDKNKTDMITRQVGADEYEKIKTYSDYRNIPCQFLLFCEDRDGSPLKNMDTLRQRMNKLNAYRIATYFHTNNKNETVEWAILRVPYEKNKSWDPDAKWDTIYFAIRNSMVAE